MSHSGPQQPDDELLELVRVMQSPEAKKTKKGKKAAEKIVRVLFPYLSGILFKITRNQDLVQDLLQETYIVLLEQEMPQAPTSFAQFRGYVGTIAVNLAIDHLRRKRRRPEEHAPPPPRILHPRMILFVNS